ncbi:short-chain dehydrogenase/reductase SDR, partial [mine drainage metagenome]
ARFLAGERYELILTARGREDLERTAASVRELGVEVVALPGDVADPLHRARLRSVATQRGRIDVLVNNASELGPSPLPHLAEYPLDQLERVYSINVVAPVGLVQELLPLLESARGWVINISSDAALGGYPGWGGYGASKAALDLVGRTLANELRERGIAIVSVDPGDMRTTMHQAAYAGRDISDRPLPDVTLPFWAWLLHQDPTQVSGHRFQAQAERWEVVR